MRDFLKALGRPVSIVSLGITLAPIMLIAVSLLALRFLIHCAAPDLSLSIHIFTWVIWLYWQGVVFERTRRSLIKHDQSSAYRLIFHRQIKFGLACWIAQVAAPVTVTRIHDNLLSVYCGVVAASAGGILLLLSFATIGIAYAAFAAEYEEVPQRHFRTGPYRFAVHPMFTAGLSISAGLALCCSPDAIGLGLALVNGIATCLYNVTEGKRYDAVQNFNAADESLLKQKQ